MVIKYPLSSFSYLKLETSLGYNCFRLQKKVALKRKYVLNNTVSILYEYIAVEILKFSKIFPIYPISKSCVWLNKFNNKGSSTKLI